MGLICRRGLILVAFFGSLGPVAASAQQTSGIAGVAKDTSGAVLPGVTVEAASPALIEKVRTVATDGEGRYNIVDLPPGAYIVTFTLAGFGTFRRDGIALSSGFTATVDAVMRVGALEESITVSGSSPVVDTQNVRKQLVATDELLRQLPTSSKQIYTLVTLTPGYTGVTDVGGQYAAEAGSFHGKRGTKVSFNGMGVENSSGNSSYQINAATVEEMVLQTSGISAEVNADGPVMNIVPKSGGNTFQTILAGLYSNNSMESDNLSDELRSRGLNASNKRVKIFDESVSLGGPIMKDRIWFFGALRTWGMAKQFAGVYWNETQDQSLTPPGATLRVVPYKPWVDRPLDSRSSRWESYDSQSGRVTWQAAAKHKVDFFIDHQIGCNCGSIGANNTVETYVGSYKFEPNRFVQVTWNSPQTSRLLLEAGYRRVHFAVEPELAPGVQPDVASVTDVGLGIQYGSSATYRGRPNYTNRATQRFSMTYVTGSHSFKTGIQAEQLFTDQFIFANANMSYTFRGGTPISITQRTTPYRELDKGHDLGIFVQDQWKVDRFTFSLGVRYDHFVGFDPAQDLPGATDEDFDRQLSRRTDRRHVRESMDRTAPFRQSHRHPQLEGHQPSTRRRVRSLRRRSDGAENVARAVRGEDQCRRLAAAEPDQHVGQLGVARVDRCEQELRAGLRPRELRLEWRMRRAEQPVLRPDEPECDLVGGRSPERLGRQGSQLGLLRGDPAPAADEPVHDRRLLPQHRRLLSEHRQQVPGRPTTSWSRPPTSTCIA